MAEKIKLTKGELKRQRDALGQYRRYLPTLQLKKQQLQLEILRESRQLEEKRKQEHKKVSSAGSWAGLLSEPSLDVAGWVRPRMVRTEVKNIAGHDVPVFKEVVFEPAEYDLFLTPLWTESAIVLLKELYSLRREIALIEEGIVSLQRELRTTSQRVNLFEKVKIPQAQEAIRVIKIAIGDRMTNAVVRSKIAKTKSFLAQEQEVGVLV